MQKCLWKGEDWKVWKGETLCLRSRGAMACGGAQLLSCFFLGQRQRIALCNKKISHWPFCVAVCWGEPGGHFSKPHLPLWISPAPKMAGHELASENGCSQCQELRRQSEFSKNQSWTLWKKSKQQTLLLAIKSRTRNRLLCSKNKDSSRYDFKLSKYFACVFSFACVGS